MNIKIQKLLEGKEQNYIFPFLWMHGEPEETIRKYMKVIYDSNIRAVCVESRPHPDFCGEQWWHDMDIILEEARIRGMKVWILDDSHFPTGYANGAMKTAPEELCRQNIVNKSITALIEQDCYDLTEYLHPVFEKTMIERYIISDDVRKFDDDRFLAVIVCKNGKNPIDVTKLVSDNILHWQAPEAGWKINICVLTRNLGPHREYINMLNARSCKILIDTVYETHYARYKEDFGATIAGFFSDEPELGNGHLYAMGKSLGTQTDLPWSVEVETKLQERLGEDWLKWLPVLWNNDMDAVITARIRKIYMDIVTECVKEYFSMQIGNWCHEHGVEYVGHLIEDNNQHARMGSSLGHYFRCLAGQDMAGIDDIGGQVLPQGEDMEIMSFLGISRDGTFYHFVLGKLGASLASLDPRKKGRSMCEIFGDYGWSEGVKLEKYLLEHFLVRGINHYVPHAFSMKAYPDPDCPPHFYADGHDPQYRHFGKLMQYTNRVCELISDGITVTPIAILYHAEAEWTGKCMLMQVPARILAEHQIDYDFVPIDALIRSEEYNTDFGEKLSIGNKKYQMLLIPTMEYISKDMIQVIKNILENGGKAAFIDGLPIGVYDGDNSLLNGIKNCMVITENAIANTVNELIVPDVKIIPANKDIRYLHYEGDSNIYYLLNESPSIYYGKVFINCDGPCYCYNGWENRLESVQYEKVEGGTCVTLELEPAKGYILVFDHSEVQLQQPICTDGMQCLTLNEWKRSICTALEYPNFSEIKEVLLPDSVEKEYPSFSGFVRYETLLPVIKSKKVILTVTDAAEGVEVFTNGHSLGIQVVPEYRYDLTDEWKDGENLVTIEVATTLERDAFERIKAIPSAWPRQQPEPLSKSGIFGTVKLYIL